jgi:hypothetical protein
MGWAGLHKEELMENWNLLQSTGKYNKRNNAIAHNVPAVGGVFAARIRALRSKDQGCKNVGGGWRGNARQRSWRAQRNDLAIAEAEGL